MRWCSVSTESGQRQSLGGCGLRHGRWCPGFGTRRTGLVPDLASLHISVPLWKRVSRMRTSAPDIAQLREITPLPGIKVKVENLDMGHELILVDQTARGARMDLSHPAIRGRYQGVYPVLIGCDAPQCPDCRGLRRPRDFTGLHAYDLLLLLIDPDQTKRGRHPGGDRTAGSYHRRHIPVPSACRRERCPAPW